MSEEERSRVAGVKDESEEGDDGTVRAARQQYKDEGGYPG